MHGLQQIFMVHDKKEWKMGSGVRGGFRGWRDLQIPKEKKGRQRKWLSLKF